jgi:hypothetical protein
MEAMTVSFVDCVKKLNQYTTCYGWQCDINSWVRKEDSEQVWVIILQKGPVIIRATGNNLLNASEQMLILLGIAENIALSI